MFPDGGGRGPAALFNTCNRAKTRIRERSGKWYNPKVADRLPAFPRTKNMTPPRQELNSRQDGAGILYDWDTAAHVERSISQKGTNTAATPDSLVASPI